VQGSQLRLPAAEAVAGGVEALTLHLAIEGFMKKILSLLLALISVSFSFGCGGSAGSPNVNSSGGSAGSAKLVIHNSQSKDDSKDYGAVKIYKVSVSGAGIAEPIEVEFSGDSESGVIEGIPSGAERKVEVSAINNNDQLIRQGAAEGVHVAPGAVSEVDVEMDAVPIFANLRDGNVVKDTRLRFELFADPEDPLHVEEVLGDSNVALFDVVTDSAELYPDINSGIAMMVPAGVTPGEHSFKVYSDRTGRSSAVTIKVIDGTKVKPAPIYSGGNLGLAGNYISVARMGAFHNVPVKSGALWPITLGYILTEF
jgi:hypothetical protein